MAGFSKSQTLAEPQEITQTFMEEHAVSTIKELGVLSQPTRVERHLVFELRQPLTPGQLWALEQLKKRDYFAGFYIKDEVTHE